MPLLDPFTEHRIQQGSSAYRPSNHKHPCWISHLMAMIWAHNPLPSLKQRKVHFLSSFYPSTHWSRNKGSGYDMSMFKPWHSSNREQPHFNHKWACLCYITRQSLSCREQGTKSTMTKIHECYIPEHSWLVFNGPQQCHFSKLLTLSQLGYPSCEFQISLL